MWPPQNPSNLTGLRRPALLFVCSTKQTFQKGTEKAPVGESNSSQRRKIWSVPQILHRALNRECLWPHPGFWGLECNRRDNPPNALKSSFLLTSSGPFMLDFLNSVKCLLFRCPPGAQGINKQQQRPVVSEGSGCGRLRVPSALGAHPWGCADLPHPELHTGWRTWPWTSLLHFNRLVRSPHTAYLEFRHFLCLHKDQNKN